MKTTRMAHIPCGRWVIVGTLAISFLGCGGQQDTHGPNAGGATAAGGTSSTAGPIPIGELGGTTVSAGGGVTNGGGDGSAGYGGGPCVGTMDEIAPSFTLACPSRYPSADEWLRTCTYDRSYLGACGGYWALLVSPGTWQKSCYYDESSLELVGAVNRDDVPSFCNRSSFTRAAGAYPDSCPVTLLMDLGECVTATRDAGVGAPDAAVGGPDAGIANCDPATGVMTGADAAVPPTADLPATLPSPSAMGACDTSPESVASIVNVGELRAALAGAWIACPGTEPIRPGAVGIEFRADGSWSPLVSQDGATLQRGATIGTWDGLFQCVLLPRPVLSLEQSLGYSFYSVLITVNPVQLRLSEGGTMSGSGRYLPASAGGN